MIPLHKLELTVAIVRTLRKRPASLDGLDARLRFHQHTMLELDAAVKGLIAEGTLGITDGTLFVRGPATNFGALEYTHKDAVGHAEKNEPPLPGQLPMFGALDDGGLDA